MVLSNNLDEPQAPPPRLCRWKTLLLQAFPIALATLGVPEPFTCTSSYVQDWVDQKHFHICWDKDSANLADCYTKHHFPSCTIPHLSTKLSAPRIILIQAPNSHHWPQAHCFFSLSSGEGFALCVRVC